MMQKYVLKIGPNSTLRGATPSIRYDICTSDASFVLISVSMFLIQKTSFGIGCKTNQNFDCGPILFLAISYKFYFN